MAGDDPRAAHVAATATAFEKALREIFLIIR